MLYCHPDAFYNEMQMISDHNELFLKKLCPTTYKIPDEVVLINPLEYLIRLVLNEEIEPTTNAIFALRTFGSYNSLEPIDKPKAMNVFFAKLDEDIIYISHKNLSSLSYGSDGEMYFCYEDGYGDVFRYTLDDVVHNKDDPMAITSYISYYEDVFSAYNLWAKIPVGLVKDLA